MISHFERKKSSQKCTVVEGLMRAKPR